MSGIMKKIREKIDIKEKATVVDNAVDKFEFKRKIIEINIAGKIYYIEPSFELGNELKTVTAAFTDNILQSNAFWCVSGEQQNDETTL